MSRNAADNPRKVTQNGGNLGHSGGNLGQNHCNFGLNGGIFRRKFCPRRELPLSHPPVETNSCHHNALRPFSTVASLAEDRKGCSRNEFGRQRAFARDSCGQTKYNNRRPKGGMLSRRWRSRIPACALAFRSFGRDNTQVRNHDPSMHRPRAARVGVSGADSAGITPADHPGSRGVERNPRGRCTCFGVVAMAPIGP